MQKAIQEDDLNNGIGDLLDKAIEEYQTKNPSENVEEEAENERVVVQEQQDAEDVIDESDDNEKEHEDNADDAIDSLDDLIGAEATKQDDGEQEDEPEEENSSEKTTDDEGQQEDSSDEDNEEDLKNPHFKGIKKRIDKAKKSAEKRVRAEYEEKVKQLESELSEARASKQVTSLSDDERKEYLMLKRRFDVQNDPELKKSYDDKISLRDRQAKEILKKHAVNDEYRKRVDEIGSISEFAAANPKGMKEIIEKISAVDSIDGTAISSAIAEARLLKGERDEKVKELSSEAEKYFAEIEEKKQVAEKNRVESINAANKAYEETFYKAIDNTPTLAKKPIPETASPEEREYIKKHNASVDAMKRVVKAGLTVSNSNDAAKILFAAGRSVVLQNRVAELEKKLSDLQSKQEAVRESSRIHKNTMSPARVKTKPMKKTQGMSSEDSLDELIAREQAKLGGIR